LREQAGANLGMAKLTTIEIDIEDLDSCLAAAFTLHTLMSRQHGEERARKIFEVLGPLHGRDFKRWKLWELAAAYRKMPERNIRKFANELAEQNKTLPQSERHGPQGAREGESMRRQLYRMLKDPEFLLAVKALDLAQQRADGFATAQAAEIFAIAQQATVVGQ
jgi:hypothetical protein